MWASTSSSSVIVSSSNSFYSSLSDHWKTLKGYLIPLVFKLKYIVSSSYSGFNASFALIPFKGWGIDIKISTCFYKYWWSRLV